MNSSMYIKEISTQTLLHFFSATLYSELSSFLKFTFCSATIILSCFDFDLNVVIMYKQILQFTI